HISMQKSFVKILLGTIILVLLPGILLIDDASLSRFAIPYLSIMIPSAILATWMIYSSVTPLESSLKKAFVVAIMCGPFVLFSIYPFTFTGVLLVFMLSLIGIGLPYWSREMTVWFYTLGGLFPLPDEHKWLLVGHKGDVKSGRYSTKLIERLGSVGASIGIVIFLMVRNSPVSTLLIVMKLLSLIVIFGLGLTLGASLKKSSLQSL
ncbi:MAG: hypothetical protein KDJ52_34515, partial [Anaerolineae bacterium]|nr:hypothetical protein [Anaerolineae bacterium]